MSRQASTSLGFLEFLVCFPKRRGSVSRPIGATGGLRSFEFDAAGEAFREAQAIDLDFALAYWGEALSCHFPLWTWQDRETALTVLARYAPTPQARAARLWAGRERSFMEAADVLYGSGDKLARDFAYSEAMRRLHERIRKSTTVSPGQPNPPEGPGENLRGRRPETPVGLRPPSVSGRHLPPSHPDWRESLSLIVCAALRLFLADGRVEMDSNNVENLIRPIALNRKSALFAGTRRRCRRVGPERFADRDGETERRQPPRPAQRDPRSDRRRPPQQPPRRAPALELH